MSAAPNKPNGQSGGPAPVGKRRGIAVTTPHGRALTFGVPRDRTERLMETLALQARKAARSQASPPAPPDRQP